MRIGAQEIQLRPARVNDVRRLALVRRHHQVKHRLDVAGGGVTLARVGGKIFFVLRNRLIEQRQRLARLAGEQQLPRLFVQPRHFWGQRDARAAENNLLVVRANVWRVKGLAVGKRGSECQG